MAGRLSKKQRTQVRMKHKEKKRKRYESQDAKGISRKKYKLVINPKTFFIMKAIGIVAIPVVYFVYSPLLIVVMFYFIGLFFAGIGCEHSLNKSVIRSNHIKIPKYDSAIALVLISIGIFGSIFTASRGRIGMFTNTLWMKITQALQNMGTLLTGVRTIFSSDRQFDFGAMERPEGFIPNEEALFDRFGSGPPPGGEFGGKPHIEFSMDNIPVEFMFSQLLSTVTTVLLVAVGVFGALSLWLTIKKIKRFELEQNEVIVDGSIRLLEDEEVHRILDFGELIENY